MLYARGLLRLASRSPRRLELLQTLGFEVELCPADVDEHIEPTDQRPAEAIAADLAGRKLAPVLEMGPPHVPVLAADTLVVVNNDILGKPVDRNNARFMLERLRGVEHRVITGFALGFPGQNVHQYSVSTKVWFRSISDAEINSYLNTQEPYDKAGAYGIQSRAGAFIDRVEGSYPNIVGLPVHEVLKAIEDMKAQG